MPDHRPNIVLIISHDLGRHIGPYGWAEPQSERLTRLAAEGMRFNAHFVSSPGCSQSRSSLVTGRYPHANGQFGLAHLGWTLNRDEVVLPAMLKDAGYRTVLFGIWHLHEWTLGSFDSISSDVSTRDASPEGAAAIASSRAAAWIRNRTADERPFYLHVGFFETHRPFCEDEAQVTADQSIDHDRLNVPAFLPDNSAVRRELAELHHAVSEVDRGVGRILDALDESGQRERTLVLFTADHGLPFPRAKGTLYDPGIQAAFLARWPGRIAPGSVCRHLTSNVDVMPTLLESAEIPVPQRVQGESFLPALIGEAGSPRDAIFAEKTYHEHYDPMRCIRTLEWKYIYNFADRPRLVMPSDIYNSPTRQSMTEDELIWSPRPEEELYDLQADATERNNLADQPSPPAEIEDLRARLTKWMQATHDPLLQGPIPRPAS